MKEIDSMIKEFCETYENNFVITIPDMGPSCNDLYRIGKSRWGKPMKILNPKVKVFWRVMDLHIGSKKFVAKGNVAAILIFSGPWINKSDGLNKKADLDNRIKVTLDGLVNSRMAFKDEKIWQLHAFKVHCQTKETQICLFDLG